MINAKDVYKISIKSSKKIMAIKKTLDVLEKYIIEKAEKGDLCCQFDIEQEISNDICEILKTNGFNVSFTERYIAIISWDIKDD